MEVRSLRADVLVVGGGLAALRAAYEARGVGADVVVAVKGRAGRSGSSAMTSAGYSTARSEGDSAELHYQDTMAGGRGLNDSQLVRVMVEEAPQRLDELVALGAPLVLDDDGRQAVSPSGDHSRPRTYGAANHSGRDFTEPLTRAVIERGARVLEMTAVVEVLTKDGQVVGAVALDYREGAVVHIETPSVILGTGGAGRLFEVTSNPNDATGDGYALALRAGAQVRDMEFIQFYPWRCIIPFDRSRMPIQPSTFVLGGRLYNSADERFMVGYDPVRKEASTRDLAARAIYEQIHERKGVRGGVRLDVSALSLEEWTRCNPRPARHFLDRNLDFHEEEMILAPEAHFFMGGVVVDAWGQSRVPGLFAVGEVAGGVHGANRLDSNAIPETQVFGARAGRAAAQLAATGARPSVIPEWAGYERLGAAGPQTPQSGSIYVELRRQLQKVMWEQLGIIRDGAEMAIGIAEVAQLDRRLSELEPVSVGDSVQQGTLANSLLVARCCFTAAHARRESRGAHYRRDFPDTDDANWRFPLLLELRADGSLTESPRPVGAGAGELSRD